MTAPAILGQLSNLQEMMRELVRSVPSEDANARFHQELYSLAWYLGHAVYREAYWIREVLTSDADLTTRVRHIFTPGALDPDTRHARIPPPDHLLTWAREIQDEHLRRLASPGALPAHTMLEADRLQWYLLQEAAREYETMLMVLLARSLERSVVGYRVQQPLAPRVPAAETAQVTQGHYRIGARTQPYAYDNEHPPQAVELSGFRIAKRPVTNAEYLAFMDSGGYRHEELWSEPGQRWLATSSAEAPLHWRLDGSGRWYGVGLHGPTDLPPNEPVTGVNGREAAAYAAWAAKLGGALSGALVQHEYQWEVAARSGAIGGIGSVWEWCSNPLHPYPEFVPFPDETASQAHFGRDYITLRGASLHTQRCLRRASFRNWAGARARHCFAGIRLVFPPQ